jgi:signal transduction histidine kinase
MLLENHDPTRHQTGECASAPLERRNGGAVLGRKPLSRVAVKFLLILIPIVSVFTCAVIILIGFVRYQESTERLVDEVTLVATSSAHTLAGPIWARNRNVIQDVVDSLVVASQISCAQVLGNEGGITFAAKGEPCATSDGKTKTVSADVVYAGERLGTVVLGINPAVAAWELKETLAEIAWLFLALTAAGIVAAIVALRATVLAPLERLLSAIRDNGGETLNSPVEWRSGDELGEVIGAYNDMVARINRREVALRDSEERLRGAVSSMQEGFMLYDGDDRLVAWNDAFLRMAPQSRKIIRVGITFEEILRNAVAKDTLPAAKGNEESFIRQRLRAHNDPRSSFVLEIAGSGTFIVKESRTPEGGTATSFIDISELKQTEEDLRIAMAEVERGSHAKSEFLATMSHELRTPLNSIIGFSDVMRTEMFGALGNEKYAEYARDINASGQHLLDIVGDILDLSKIEAGRMELDDEVFPVADAVAASLRLIDERARENGLTLTSDLPHAGLQIMADSRAVKQMLLNLLSNAVKFTPDGGTISVKAGREPDGAVLISVSDSGIGIAENDLARVLEPFTQAHEVITQNLGGTGLGLPVVRSLIELHGGTLDLASQPGEGTTATLRFPPPRTMSS